MLSGSESRYRRETLGHEGVSMKPSYIIIMALVVLLLIAGGCFWFWTTTPQYSLAQIRDAISEHDISKFQMYFNTDQVAESMVKDLIKSPLRKTLGGETLERYLTTGMVSESTIVHEVGSSIAGDIKVLVETGKFIEQAPSDTNKVSMGVLDQRLGIRTLQLKEVKSIQVTGNDATVTMLLHSGKFNTDLELLGELRNRDGYWQATRLLNVVQCFEKLFELEGKD